MNINHFLRRTLAPVLSALLLLNGCGTGEPAVPDEPAVGQSGEPDGNEATAVQEAKVPSADALSAPKTKEKPLELSLYYDAYNKEYLDALIDSFEDFYPEVNIVLHDYTDLSAAEAKRQLGEDLQNSTAPDLILDYVNAGYTCIPNTMHLLDSGEFLPLDRLNLDTSDCSKAVLTCGQYRGTQYFLPLNFSLGCLFTTDSAMTDLGILDGSRVTLAEFSEKVAQFYGEFPGKYAFRNLFNSNYLYYHDGVSLFDSRTGELLPEDEVRRTAEEYMGYYEGGLFPDFWTTDYSKATETYGGDALKALRAEDLLFYSAPHFIGGLDTLMTFNKTYTELTEAGETPLVFPLPTADGGAPRPVMNWYFAVNADTENTTAVRWFMENAVHHETQCQIGWYYGLPASDYALDVIYDFYTEPDTFNRRQYSSIFPLFGEFSREFVDSYFEPIRKMRETEFTDSYLVSWITEYIWQVELGEKTPDEIWDSLWNRVTAYVKGE